MLKTRVLTAIILAGSMLAAIFLLPARATVLVFGAVCACGAWEWSALAALRAGSARAAYLLLIGVLLLLGWFASADPALLRLLLLAACLWWLVALAWLALAPARQRPLVTLCLGPLVLVPAFVALARLQVGSRGPCGGAELVLWLLLLVIAADIGAFFAGRRYGRHKLAPRVSPGKTVEGAAGGLAAAAAVSYAAALRLGLGPWSALGFGLAIGVFSIVGDLTESMFKRAAGLKDSGTILPGHGGVMDRIDSITAAAPLYALLLLRFGAPA